MSGPGYRYVFDFGSLEVVLILLLLIITAALYRKTWPPVRLSKRILLIILRSAVFILLTLFIADPAFVLLKNVERDPIIPVLLDISGSMRIKDHGGKTRIESALEDIRRIKERSDNAEIKIIPFASDIYDSDVDIDSIPSSGTDGTDIFYSLRRASERYRYDNLPAVIVLSDGRITRGMKSGNERIPLKVYTIGYGDTSAGVDVRIEDLDIDRRLYLGTSAQAGVVIRVENTGPVQLTAELLADGRVVDRKEVSSPGGTGILKAALRFRPEKTGEEILTVRVIPVEGELFTENNIETVRVTVLKDRIGILFIDQYSDWNITFLKRLFDQSERYLIDVVTSMQNGGYRMMPGEEVFDLSYSLSDPDRYDLIIVGDDKILFDSGDNVDSIERFIKNGGSILFLACEDSPLMSSRRSESLDDLLPILRTGEISIAYGDFSPRSAPLPGNMPFASLLASTDLSERLPPLLAVFTGFTIKSGAEVPFFLDHGGEESPFIAIHRYGNGVSAALFGFPLWRWNLAGEKGAFAYRAFFSGLIDYMVEGVNLPVMTLGSDRGVYLSGERCEITAQVRENTPLSSIKGEIRNIGTEEDILVRTFNLLPEGISKEIFRSSLDPLSPGKYRVVASGMNRSGEILSAETEIIVESVSVEYLRRSRDQDMLRRIADSSGGRALESDEIFRLDRLIDPGKESVMREEIVSLRTAPAFFLAIIAAFAAEWSLRKFWGLV
ncbi:MAG: VWA domain-containing protein [Candidatus Krumholzibacteriota bacterium]|nr:VWA domain-containing protein [Candidatus Krumholzibacteriota bacterium]